MSVITFKCAACKKTVTEEHDDEMALAQLQRDYPETSARMLVEFGDNWRSHAKQVCETCYDLIKNIVGEKKGATIQ